MSGVSDFLGFTVHNAALEADLRAFDRTMRRATQQGLREVGRQVKREARKLAPVYKGPARSVKVTTGSRGADGKRSYGKSIEIEPGLLKNSIKSSRRIRQPEPGVYRIALGPRGGHVHLYAAKQEARTPFMRPAYDKVEPEMRAIYGRVFGRVVNRA